jgi:hypothetical protein
MPKTIKVIKRSEAAHCEARRVSNKPDCHRNTDRDIAKTINSWVGEYKLNKTAEQILISDYLRRKKVYETAQE